MAILAFQKPEKVIMLESTSSFGKFEFRPLEPGFGMTVGNAFASYSALFAGGLRNHDCQGRRCRSRVFAAIPGVMEDMLNIILKLKQVRFIRTVDNQDAEKVSINVAGVTELTAGYISNYLSLFQGAQPRAGDLPPGPGHEDADDAHDRQRPRLCPRPRRIRLPTASSERCLSTRSLRRSKT